MKAFWNKATNFSKKVAYVVLVVTSELGKRGREHLITSTNCGEKSDRSTPAVLAIGERLRAGDPVASDPNLPKVLSLVTTNVMELVTDHVIVVYKG